MDLDRNLIFYFTGESAAARPREAEPGRAAGDCRHRGLYRRPVHLPPGHGQGQTPGAG